MIAALLGEGTSDRALLPILRWVMASTSPADVRLEWVDSTRFVGPGRGLSRKVEAALLACPCDLLFVHRDADQQPPEWRYTEIAAAVAGQRHVAVVPVRTTEAWLLLDGAAILAAAGRPSGPGLDLTPARQVERMANPKRRLHDALRTASDLTGRRARQFDVSAAVHRVADLVEDWSPLRALPAFLRLERDTRAAINGLGLPVYGAD